MDLYYGDYYRDNNVLGVTSMYVDGTLVGGSYNFLKPTCNWVWGRINLNSYAGSGLTAIQRKTTVAHEMGHVMGLAHPPIVQTAPALMFPSLNTAVSAATKDDLAGINHLY